MAELTPTGQYWRGWHRRQEAMEMAGFAANVLSALKNCSIPLAERFPSAGFSLRTQELRIHQSLILEIEVHVALRSGPSLDNTILTDMSDRDSKWIEQVRKGDEQAFEELFRAHYTELCGFAADYLNSVDRARDVVQDAFLRIWRQRNDIEIQVSLKSYLYQTVRNRALNEIRNSKTRDSALQALKNEIESRKTRTAVDKIGMDKLSDEVTEAISELPERRRMAFLLHRRHGFTYKEVAQIMEIAPKTVENQIGRALKSLRSRLEGLFAGELDR